KTKAEEAVRSGGMLYVKSKYRLSGVEERDGKLHLRLGVTDYREYQGTNIEASRDEMYRENLILRGLERFDDPLAFFSNPLGIDSVLETADGQLVVGLRSDAVGEYGGTFHCVGGHPEPKDYVVSPDLFHAMKKEIMEEIGVHRENIEGMKILGISTNAWSLKKDVLFYSKIKQTFDEIKHHLAEDEKEHSHIFGLPKEQLIPFLIENQTTFTLPPNNLTLEERSRLTPSTPTLNPTNHFCPPGEAAFILYLLNEGVDVKEALPYLGGLS
ncbi:MAG: hypothetical protein ACE5FT_03775, partial [Candidatus Nanoarchaeia archaeon]